MATRKFDELDRQAVLGVVQSHLSVTLSPVGRRRKWFRDTSGRSFWIVGGYGEWHGIPEQMMDAEVRQPSQGSLVVAARHKESLKIFMGPLDRIVENRDKLYRARKISGDYQFTTTQRGSRLYVNQVSGACLTELGSVPYTASDRSKDQAVGEAKRALDKLSPRDREQLRRELLGDG